MNYEESLKKLEQIIEMLNNPKTSMQDALIAFEEGVKQIKFCQDEIKKINGKVAILKEEMGTLIEEEE